MNGPWNAICEFSAVVLLFTTLPRVLFAETHRCLREFDPGNCNAMEELWAFDADEKNCVEVIYGGCGRPNQLSNRFETLKECQETCAHLIRNGRVVERVPQEAKEENNYYSDSRRFKSLPIMPTKGAERRFDHHLQPYASNLAVSTGPFDFKQYQPAPMDVHPLTYRQQLQHERFLPPNYPGPAHESSHGWSHPTNDHQFLGRWTLPTGHFSGYPRYHGSPMNRLGLHFPGPSPLRLYPHHFPKGALPT